MKKGFTLIELLGVIAILALIAIIAIPTIDKSLSKSKQKLFDAQVETIIEASKSWVADNIEMLPTVSGNKLSISLLTLKKGGYVAKDITNPITKELFIDESYVLITKKNENFIYEYINDEALLSEFAIILNGSDDVYLNYGETYKDEGCTVKDFNGNIINTDISVTIYKKNQVVSSVDSTQYGVYRIVYKAIVNDVEISAERKVRLIDMIKPTLSLEKETTISTSVTSFDVLEGVSATDNSGDDVTIEVSGNISLRIPGTYKLVYKATDSSGNTTTAERTIIVIKILYVDNSGANYPEIQGKMVPIIIEEDGTVKKADTSSEWYNYKEKKWANVVILNVEDTYNEGEVIPSSVIDAYYVWIPRYEYKIAELSTVDVNNPPAISINFVSTSVTEANNTENYIMHPAFTFGSDEIKGIWVGKFEVSGTITTATESSVDASLKVLPTVNSLVKKKVSQFFYSMLDLKNTYEVTDTHMIKNSEWGAVAYLTHSVYGRCTDANTCKEIGINIIGSSSGYIYLTGYGAPAGSSTSATKGAYNTDLGKDASTTGNIYGIYDMSGGAEEYVMGYNKYLTSISDESAFKDKSGFENVNSIDSKYKDEYESTNIAETLNTTGCATNNCIGHALSETAGYYGDADTFLDSIHYWFGRGGSYSWATQGGVFASTCTSGASVVTTSRPIVITY